jgi:hypothetical protein
MGCFCMNVNLILFKPDDLEEPNLISLYHTIAIVGTRRALSLHVTIPRNSLAPTRPEKNK